MAELEWTRLSRNLKSPSPKYLSKIRKPKSTIESIVKTLEAEKFEESNIELFVEAAYEDADETVDEVIIEKTVIELIIETVLEEADEITIEEIVINSIRGV